MLSSAVATILSMDWQSLDLGTSELCNHVLAAALPLQCKSGPGHSERMKQLARALQQELDIPTAQQKDSSDSTAEADLALAHKDSKMRLIRESSGLSKCRLSSGACVMWHLLSSVSAGIPMHEACQRASLSRVSRWHKSIARQLMGLEWRSECEELSNQTYKHEYAHATLGSCILRMML